MKRYKAPWSRSLVVISSLVTALLVGVTLFVIWTSSGMLRWMALPPVAIVFGSALFTIRGYTVTSDWILVHRLIWTTRLPIAGLQSAHFEPEATRRSIKTMGNGGLFSFTGFFYNKALGPYRAFVTDQHRTVVLRFSRRTVVVSPGEPEEFVQDLVTSRTG
jgi:hypothetical protein